MGIYDPVLQAYQHGVDQRIQLASQPMTLAQSILGGYQQGFGNRMQQEHLGLQRDQLAEQMRRAQAQEAEARLWHQSQMQDKLLRQAQDNTYNTPEEADASQQMLIQNGIDPRVASFLIKKPQETADSKASRYAPLKDQNWAGSVDMSDMGGSNMPMEPLKTTDQYNPEDAPKEYTPTMGGKALLKSRGLDIREDQNAVLAELKRQRNQIAEDYNNGRLESDAAKLAAKVKMAELDRKIKAQTADAATSRAASYGRYVDKWQPANVAITGGSGAINRGSKQWQDQYRIELNNLQKNYSDMGLSSGEMSQQAAERADAVFNPNRTDVVPKDGAPPQPQPQPQPKPQPVAKTVGPQAGNEDPGIKHETLGTNPRFKKAVWAERGPNGRGWYEKRNGTPVKVE